MGCWNGSPASSTFLSRIRTTAARSQSVASAGVNQDGTLSLVDARRIVELFDIFAALLKAAEVERSGTKVGRSRKTSDHLQRLFGVEPNLRSGPVMELELELVAE